MKIILTTAAIVFFTLPAIVQIQISNSKWKGQTEVPRTADVDLEFTKDTFRIIGQAGRGLEVIFFSQHNDSLYIRKISGASPCPEGTEAWYRIEWLENSEKFLLHLINDSCTRRANGIKAIRINQRIRAANETSRNWSYQSLSKDSVPGINLYGAHELLKGKKSTTVIVAIIGGGFDREHEDLKEVTWLNAKEIAGNEIDDDKNGYTDDTWGWNFISDKKGNTVSRHQQDVTYIYKLWKKKYDNAKPARLNDEEKEQFEIYQQAKKIWQEKYQLVPMYKLVLTDSARYLNTVKEFAGHFSNQPISREVFINYNTAADLFKTAVKKTLLTFFPPPDSIHLGMFIQSFKDRWRGLKNNANGHILAYDLEYNPERIIGDDSLNVYEKKYGSPYIIIPPGDSFFNHDTHIAGLIGAKRNNGIGIDGIADNVKIMMIKIGAGGDERDKDVANGIRYAVDNGAKVINMSWGKNFSSHKKVVDEAVRYAEQKDVLLVNSAGNEGSDCDTINYYPVARYRNGNIAGNFLEVGCSRMFYDSRLIPVYSNYGKHTVHLFAPGHNSFGPLPGNEYGHAGGTSNAAPLVVGVAALLKSYFPQLSMLRIKEIILETVQQPDLKVIGPQFIEPGLRPALRAKIAAQGELVPFQSLSITGGILDAEAAVKKALEITKQKTVKGF